MQDEEQKIRRTKKQIVPPSILEHGKLPPQAVDLEEAILGAIMLEKDAMMQVVDILKPEMFYKESHNRIFTAITELFRNVQPVDILTVTDQLKKMGYLDVVGGHYYIITLTSRVASSANIEYHTKIVQQKYIQRELIRISSEIIRDAFEDTTDVLELLGNAETQLMTITEKNTSKRSVKYSDAVVGAVDDLKYLCENPTKLTGIPSGLTEMDRKTGGWQQSDLIIKAGRPGMGKSTESFQEAMSAAEVGHSSAYFSLEMSMKQLINKSFSNKFQIELSRINMGQLTPSELKDLEDYKTTATKNLFIDDSPSLSTIELRAKAIRLKQKYGIQQIIVDYLQLMTASGLTGKENREQEISKIARSLKSLAKELQIPVIALSQLSRAVEARPNKRPILSDLRESGSIEQEADIVIFFFRPEYYKMEIVECNGVQHNSAGVCLVDIAKGRNIGTGEFLLNFSGKYSKFQDFDTFYISDGAMPTNQLTLVENPPF
jgi:replicative DNA helicase